METFNFHLKPEGVLQRVGFVDADLGWIHSVNHVNDWRVFRIFYL